MKTTKKWVSTAVALTLVGSLAAGCGNGEEAPAASGDSKETAKPAAKQELRVNFNAEPPVLDSSKGTTNAAFTMLNALNEGLYRIDKDGKPQPGLAADKPQVSEDGLTYTIKLRDAKWADGQPVKASDFVYSFQRTLDPSTKAMYGFMPAWIKGGNDVIKAKPEELEAKKAALGAKALDDKTLEIKLEKPITFFEQLLAFPIFFPQREDMVTKNGEKYGGDADKIVGAGPFVLKEWKHDASLTFEKNPNYWDAANVKLEKLVVNIVTDSNTSLNLYETEETDLINLSGPQYMAKKDAEKANIQIKNELTSAYLMFNTKNKALANANIRKALTLAVDRQSYVDTILQNGTAPAKGLVADGTQDGNKNEFRKSAGETLPKADPAKAKEYLAAGLKELGIDKLPEMKLTGDEQGTGKKTIEFIMGEWEKNLGYKPVGEPIPHKLRVERQNKGDYDIIMALWGADYNDPMTFLDMWVTGSEFNNVYYSNPAYDEKIKAADKEADPAKRAQLLVDAEKILMTDMPVGPLYSRKVPYLVRNTASGLVLPNYGMEWEARWVEMKAAK
ncbi:peptide ABC transporter substrate-binding protein [Paenibacillus sp. FJAT-26967]|uniref:peptide ABC transporter substrate-binding protein n=1 Tax=Paenibacillus sp. FJAT-26967 TaxID=1729690 RepID=UPI000837FDE4|nr:peptide ABC transporter substrate-binding protein [Paenibacillus sp. FJAT-26967]